MDAMNSRQQIILQMVIDQGRVSVVDLAKATGVSEVTIRQDLNLLEKQSYLRRAHGYAVPLDSDDVENVGKRLDARPSKTVPGGQSEGHGKRHEHA